MPIACDLLDPWEKKLIKLPVWDLYSEGPQSAEIQEPDTTVFLCTRDNQSEKIPIYVKTAGRINKISPEMLTIVWKKS